MYRFSTLSILPSNHASQGRMEVAWDHPRMVHYFISAYEMQTNPDLVQNPNLNIFNKHYIN